MLARQKPPGDDIAGKHILLLDDEEPILLPTARYFRGLGFPVDVARTRAEAESLLSRRRYHLAILDLRISGRAGAEGLEVLRAIRRRDHSTSVIILSGYISPEVEARARALGADSVLAKPQPLPALALLGFSLMRAMRG
jgi:DNA-binding response OmpR family regulator